MSTVLKSTDDFSLLETTILKGCALMEVGVIRHGKDELRRVPPIIHIRQVGADTKAFVSLLMPSIHFLTFVVSIS